MLVSGFSTGTIPFEFSKQGVTRRDNDDGVELQEQWYVRPIGRETRSRTRLQPAYLAYRSDSQTLTLYVQWSHPQRQHYLQQINAVVGIAHSHDLGMTIPSTMTDRPPRFMQMTSLCCWLQVYVLRLSLGTFLPSIKGKSILSRLKHLLHIWGISPIYLRALYHRISTHALVQLLCTRIILSSTTSDYCLEHACEQTIDRTLHCSKQRLHTSPLYLSTYQIQKRVHASRKQQRSSL